MKSIIRNTFINAISLYLVVQLLSGVKVEGGAYSYLIAGVVFSLIYKILWPILNIISLPLNIVTLGLTSFLINVFLFYLATNLVSQITVTSFTFNGFSAVGFVIPEIFFNTFFAYFAAAFVQSTSVTFLSWLRK